MNASAESWGDANRRRLSELFEELAAALDEGRRLAPERLSDAGSGAAIDAFAAIFGLRFEDLAALLVAAAELLEPRALGAVPASAGTAIALGGEGAWAALCPQAPLRRWRIVELEGGGVFSERRLRLDERVMNHLVGVDYLDARLDGLVEPAPEGTTASGAGAELAAVLARSWRAEGPDGWPVLQLCGRSPEAQRAVAAALAASLGQRLFRIARADIPKGAFERVALARLCDREMALSHGALLVEGDGHDDERVVSAFLDAMRGPTVVAARDPLALARRRRIRADMPAARPAERRALWVGALNGEAHEAGPALDRMAEQFSLDAAGVRAAAELARDPLGPRESLFADRLWDAARAQARRGLDDLAERIEGGAGWDDLVLPADRIEQLRDLAAHARRAHQVHEDWGWSARGPRGLGVTALFSGASGTGKTMAAEVLAGALRLDLYRIDLAQVVSKYIGETEKNLRRIFEAAEAGGAILLFDEADALFGRRSEVKDSHDRYANVEVSYLLQRMEAYRGLAILTTNLKSALDPAFMRRLRFVVDFPFPDAAARREIWRRVFPERTPVEALDHARLSRLAVAGGAIRTIAVNAAFLAAEDGGRVTSEHVLAAARREYGKLEKPITAAEFGSGS